MPLLGSAKLGTAATEHPRFSDIAWAAGVYEGEGHCRWANGGTYATVSQKDRWLCDRLKVLFGGSVYFHVRKDNRAGFAPESPIFTWTATGARSRGFLMTIYAFLSPRRQGQIRGVLLNNRAKGHHSLRQTHCKNGHALSGSNLLIQQQTARQHKRRVCRTCKIRYRQNTKLNARILHLSPAG